MGRGYFEFDGFHVQVIDYLLLADVVRVGRRRRLAVLDLPYLLYHLVLVELGLAVQLCQPFRITVIPVHDFFHFIIRLPVFGFLLEQ